MTKPKTLVEAITAVHDVACSYTTIHNYKDPGKREAQIDGWLAKAVADLIEIVRKEKQ